MCKTITSDSYQHQRINSDRRRHPRIRICHPINYFGMDEDGCKIEQNIGLILDVSQSGILFESIQKVESTILDMMIVDIKNKIVQISGKVAYCRITDGGKFKVGVGFEATYHQKIQFVKKLILAYHHQKKYYNNLQKTSMA